MQKYISMYAYVYECYEHVCVHLAKDKQKANALKSQLSAHIFSTADSESTFGLVLPCMPTTTLVYT